MINLLNAIYKRLFLDIWKKFSTTLVRASAWLIIGGLVAGLFGYIFHVFMGRMLSVQEYGLFSALIALLATFSAPLGTLLMIISRKVSAYRARGDQGSITQTYYSTSLRIVVASSVLIAIILLFSGQIRSYLNAPSNTPIYLISLIFLITIPRIINNAYLQGLQNFRWLCFGGVLEVLIKTVAAVAFVWIGYGVSGVLGGIILAGIIVWLVTYGVLFRSLASGRGRPYRAVSFSLGSVLPVLIANTAFAAMTQLDMVLVKYYFTEQDAGIYAAASILGKAVMYLPGGIAMALFPMAAENHARSEGSAHLLLQALGLTFLLCSAGALFYFLFGETVVVLLYGESYRSSGVLLNYYGFAILPMALVMVMQHFLIAKGRVFFIYVFSVMAPLELVAIHLFHDSLVMVIAVIGVSGSLLVLSLLWQALRENKFKLNPEIK